MIDLNRFVRLVLTAETHQRRGRKWSRIFLRDALGAIAGRERLQSDEPLRDFAMKYDDVLSGTVATNGGGPCEECGRVSSHSQSCPVWRRENEARSAGGREGSVTT